MITRTNLAEQLRDYQLRSSHQWKTLAFFSSTNTISSRAEATQAGFLCSVFFALWIGAVVAVYNGNGVVAALLIFLATLMLVSLRFIRQRKTARRKQKGILP